jgi:hypothetical protein
MLSHLEKTGGRANGLAIPLKALFFLIYIASCVSLWLAHYGQGVAVALAWCAGVGGAIGAVFSFIELLVRQCKNHYSTPITTKESLSESFCCVVTGTIAGLLGGAIGFAAAAPGQIANVEVHGFWFKATTIEARMSMDFTKTMATFVLVPAIVIAFANSLACSMRGLRNSQIRFIVAVAGTMGVTFGTIPTIALIAGVAYRATQSHGPSYENMDGLLPLAAPLWFMIGASVGITIGVTTAAAWLWSWHTTRSSTSWFFFWSTMTLLVMLVSQVGLRGL